MEEIMKYTLMACAFLLVSLVPSLNASKVQDQTHNYQQGTILSVEKHEVHSPEYSGGSNPSDAPLTSTFYAYDVSVRADCGTYVARYESPTEYLPSQFASGHPIQVRITKHFAYFNVPINREMKMAITHRQRIREGTCDETRHNVNCEIALGCPSPPKLGRSVSLMKRKRTTQ
jgi:hypothetical protein